MSGEARTGMPSAWGWSTRAWGWGADDDEVTSQVIERLLAEFALLADPDTVTTMVQQCRRDLDTEATPASPGSHQGTGAATAPRHNRRIHRHRRRREETSGRLVYTPRLPLPIRLGPARGHPSRVRAKVDTASNPALSCVSTNLAYRVTLPSAMNPTGPRSVSYLVAETSSRASTSTEGGAVRDAPVATSTQCQDRAARRSFSNCRDRHHAPRRLQRRWRWRRWRWRLLSQFLPLHAA